MSSSTIFSQSLMVAWINCSRKLPCCRLLAEDQTPCFSRSLIVLISDLVANGFTRI